MEYTPLWKIIHSLSGGWMIYKENFKAGPGGGQITDPCEMSPSYTNQAINILSFWRNSFTTLHQVNFLVETYEASENKESALMKK